jgi:diaminopimelate decarboxylase
VTFVGVNSGLNQLIRPMMYDAYHEIVNISNPAGSQKVYTVVAIFVKPIRLAQIEN